MTRQDSIDRQLLTLPAAAAIMGISLDRAYRMARTGTLKGAFKLGGTWRVDREVMAKWLERLGRSS